MITRRDANERASGPTVSNPSSTDPPTARRPTGAAVSGQRGACAFPGRWIDYTGEADAEARHPTVGASRLAGSCSGGPGSFDCDSRTHWQRLRNYLILNHLPVMCRSRVQPPLYTTCSVTKGVRGDLPWRAAVSEAGDTRLERLRWWW